jgi:methylated-DNA-[protein]-cysteine S-methyltransferase
MSALLLCLGRLETPLGTMLIVWDEDRLRAVDFTTHESRMRDLLRRHYGVNAITTESRDLPEKCRDAFTRYFAGQLDAFHGFTVATNGTPFQKKVWTALLQIPPGTTMSYGRLAAKIGQPSASRAVGLANGSNPIGIVVPCHRVIGANGSLTGYGGGLERKSWLLNHERRHASNRAVDDAMAVLEDRDTAR